MTRKSDALGACPFPPDKSPPPKTASTNVLEYADRFFEGWRNYLGLVTMMGLVLAYSLLVIPPPLITRATTPETWNTQLEPGSRPTDTFKWIKVREPGYSTSKQLVLEGDDVLEFRDQTVEFEDLVLAKDNARIVLRNATLIVPDYPGYLPSDIFHEYAGMVFNGSARLEAYDSVILHPGEYPGIGFIGSSSCLLVNTVVANCSLSFDESATLEAAGSTIHSVNADRSSSLKIVDSYVDTVRHENRWREMSVRAVKEVNASLYLEDSLMRLILVRVVNSSNCQITDVVGYNDRWNIYDAFNMDGATMNVTLIRSTVTEPFWVEAINSEIAAADTEATILASMSRVRIDRSNVTYIALFGSSCVTVRDSNIYSFNTGTYPIFDMYLRLVPESSFRQNATVTSTRIENIGIRANCKYNFTDVYVAEASVSGLEAVLTGSVSWGPNIRDQPYFAPYNRFAFTQEFEVHTQGPERVLPGVSLVLTDKEGNAVWEGTSDENGEAYFNLTFCSYYALYEPYKLITNYMDRWNLKATHGDETRETSIALCETGSPIVLEFPEDAFTLPVNYTTLAYTCAAVIVLATALKLWKLNR